MGGHGASYDDHRVRGAWGLAQLLTEPGVGESEVPRPPRKMKMADKNALAAAISRTAFLESVRRGRSLEEAAAAAGWSGLGTYRMARSKNPNWAAQVDAAKQLARLDATERASDGVTPPDFSGFVAKFFPDRRPHLAHQLELARELQTLRPREVCLFLLWPEAGKTATIEDYICRKLAFDPQHRFRIISEAADLSKRIVGTCARRLSDEAEYGPFIERYGPFYQKGQERDGKPWTTTQFTVWKNDGSERDRSLVAQSWSGSNYGSRIDTLIIDDVQSQANYNQADEIFRRIRGTFFNRGLEMRTIIVGTRIGQGDFYERMLDAGLITKRVVRPAADADGNPYTPEYWDRQVYHDGGPCCMGFREDTCPRDNSKLTPREFMELIRFQSSEETWWASYQQNPTATARGTFAEFVERCLDRDRQYGPLQVA